MSAIYLVIIIVILVLLISKQLNENYNIPTGCRDFDRNDSENSYSFQPLAPIYPTPPREPPTPVGKLYDNLPGSAWEFDQRDTRADGPIELRDN